MRILLLFLIVFCFGILSMGYQQVASRVLTPYFGGDYIVWSVLISTFLAAFTGGSFLGGWISALPAARRRNAVLIVAAVAIASLFLGEMVRKPLLAALEQNFDSVITALLLGCITLFGPPVVTLSSITPIAIELLSEAGVRSGRAAGRLYGVSTVGNIVGVFLTALLLIPNFTMPTILYGWGVAATVLFAAFFLLMARSWYDAR